MEAQDEVVGTQHTKAQVEVHQQECQVEAECVNMEVVEVECKDREPGQDMLD